MRVSLYLRVFVFCSSSSSCRRLHLIADIGVTIRLKPYINTNIWFVHAIQPICLMLMVIFSLPIKSNHIFILYAHSLTIYQWQKKSHFNRMLCSLHNFLTLFHYVCVYILFCLFLVGLFVRSLSALPLMK